MERINSEKTLLLMRHGKSDWEADYESDHERPLNERGIRSARLMGRLLSGLDLIPDLVLTSTATRARDTAWLAIAAGGWDTPIVEEPGLYGGSPASVLAVGSRTENAERLMLIGHEPTWSELVRHLTGRSTVVKTTTVAVIELPIDNWADLPQAKGVMVALHHPRTYFGSEWDKD